ncbi:integrase core domain-containing protein [Hyphococcus lacteus]|uniref:integrase core domain-containing protein n=1 Tax=Hyphococcus lacteus TaxID=3143536 RepID=UPI00387EC44F
MVDLGAYQYKVRMDFSRSATPTDNAHIESFDGSLRDECLNLHWFETLADARTLIEAWRRDYNVCCPRMAHGDIHPVEFSLQTKDSHAATKKISC